MTLRLIALAALAVTMPSMCATQPVPEATAEPAEGEMVIRSAPSQSIESGALPETASEPEAEQPG